MRTLMLVGALGAIIAIAYTATSVLAKPVAVRAQDRLEKVQGLFGGPKADLSLIDRRAQNHVALKAFRDHPYFGTGPGHEFSWRASQGNTIVSFNIDSALAVPAKFGLIGLSVIAWMSWVMVRTCRRIARRDGWGASHLAFQSFAIVTIAFALLGSPFEDKGFAFSVLLLLALWIPGRSPDDAAKYLPHSRIGHQ
jgi:O-antigen ligase